MGETSDACENLVGSLCPDERTRARVVGVEKLADRAFELTYAAVRSTANPLIGEFREPALDQVEPRAVGRGEVGMKARALEPICGFVVILLSFLSVRSGRSPTGARYCASATS
jgi:hypothetical protein